MIDNEQWKSGGNCSICRRCDYCTKGCKANDKRFMGLIAEEFAKTSAGKMVSEFNRIMYGGNSNEQQRS